ncbi:hypothetical protein CBM2592_P340003 [Cupriavidus taiwanensis]|uniref:Uncharacterized protein n=2 Tax=Cupriavidus TaxID=106589 RepID=A0A375CPP4_9BURK|nr:hypothetical protein CBM2592_P340003 [Cupriavidus taiwanensis]SOZ40624.1 hypothetical protein CBM2605_P310003 [Cupriavidus neocaledonicus]SOY76710.1 hypothetical protein CBM2589_P320003 [Cupriavidus taiwanensis]SOY77923.1 hypothetical protein CBM2586_P320003 [Cupriavidus taiwanensis]SOZ00314.1 hypothetical protein CBM2591_P340003 [Cupriavidus taiwanensis]
MPAVMVTRRDIRCMFPDNTA